MADTTTADYRRRLFTCLHNRRMRGVAALYWAEGWRQEWIAQHLRTSPSSISGTICRCRAAMRKAGIEPPDRWLHGTAAKTISLDKVTGWAV